MSKLPLLLHICGFPYSSKGCVRVAIVATLPLTCLVYEGGCGCDSLSGLEGWFVVATCAMFTYNNISFGNVWVNLYHRCLQWVVVSACCLVNTMWKSGVCVILYV